MRPQGEATPAYQIGFTMYENGVADNLVLDYGDFALGGNLKVLEFLEADAVRIALTA